MKHSQKAKLLGKGWSAKDIKKAEVMLEQSRSHDAFFSQIVFWSALLVIVFANIIVSLILVPFLIIFESWILFSTVILMGGMIGFLYQFLITDIGHLKRKHHLLAGILVPVLAIVNMIAVVVFSNKLIAELGTEKVKNNPFVVALVFAGAFVIPSIVGYFKAYRDLHKAVLE